MKNIGFYNPPIAVNSITWHEVSNKVSFVNVNKLTDLLNKKVKLADYGIGVTQLHFIFIAVQPTNTLHQEETTYLPKEKKLLLYRKLDYEKISAYSTEEVLRLMAETLFHALIDLWGDKIPDFDYFRLGKDVEKLFIDLGWVVSDNFYPVSRPIKPETVAAFLYSKGWEEKCRTSRYHVMLPPKQQLNLKDKQLYIPLAPNGSYGKYERAWSDVIIMLANIYNINRLELELLFSKDKEQIKKDIEMLQEVVKE